MSYYRKKLDFLNQGQYYNNKKYGFKTFHKSK